VTDLPSINGPERYGQHRVVVYPRHRFSTDVPETSLCGTGLDHGGHPKNGKAER